jgi:hypothetical protein
MWFFQGLMGSGARVGNGPGQVNGLRFPGGLKVSRK